MSDTDELDSSLDVYVDGGQVVRFEPWQDSAPIVARVEPPDCENRVLTIWVLDPNWRVVVKP